jgi:hypothetical protein
MKEQADGPRCVAFFDKPGGITTSRELIEGLSALMGDLASKRITNGNANAICNATGKVLTTVKLEQQYGEKRGEGAAPELRFIQPRGQLGAGG